MNLTIKSKNKQALLYITNPLFEITNNKVLYNKEPKRCKRKIFGYQHSFKGRQEESEQNK